MGEATVICLDGSEWMRNCDFSPSRMDAQQDAVARLCEAKFAASPESNVALMNMTATGVKVLVTLTTEVGKILAAMYGLTPSGDSDLVTSLQIAQLVLRHRQNERLRTRIVAFVSSPLTATDEALTKLGSDLKKNGVALDIVNFGEESENTGKLEVLVNAANSNGNSNLVTVPAGPHILADMLMASPIFGESGNAASFTGGYGDIGVDPTDDPELAAAIRESLEMERQRQATETVPSSTPANAAAPSSTPSAAPQTPSAAQADADSLEDELLKEALAMSKAEAPSGASASDGMDMDEEEQLRLAMQMSMDPDAAIDTASSSASSAAPPKQGDDQYQELFQNPEFLAGLLQSVSGLSPQEADEITESLKKGEAPKDKKEEPKPDGQ
eukprot:TRINITY_DN1436_c0_g1_i4.p1 TRINITY_DN1436_c0_g1~~TRINITY_DN1436_c0_g1_i4.p1  ORF type:complete len:385 (-),score=102.22 TRINITY_DN1436_c0_g1_i4:427-1581(-)